MFISYLLNDEPALATAVTWANRLNKLLRRRAAESLDEVLAAATGTLFARLQPAYAATLTPSARRSYCHGLPVPSKVRSAASRC